MVASLAPEPSEAAGLAALADRCVQCGLCLPHCPTYRLDALEPESPRGRIAYARALARGELAATDVGDSHLDHCLGCRRCEAACPAGVAFGEILIKARTAQFQRRRPPWALRWRLALLGRPGWLGPILALYRWLFPLIPARWRPLPQPPRHPTPSAPVAAGPESVSLFVGCVANTYEAASRHALTALLGKAGIAVRVPPAQACCGAAHAHAGDAATAGALLAQNQRTLAGNETVLCLASGCLDTLRTGLATQAAVEDALSFLANRASMLRFRSANGRRVALHLPCTQRASGSDIALRSLLSRIPELSLIELPDSGCCGAAGLHATSFPDRAARLRTPILDALAACDASELLSANIGCRLHLVDAARMPVRHPIDFLAEHLA